MVKASPKIDSLDYTDLNNVINWFISLRWIACAGVFIALLVVQFKLNHVLPYTVLYSLNALLIASNILFTIYFHKIKRHNLDRREIFRFLNLQICCDYFILFFLIYFSGFLANPLKYYFIYHILMTSYIFSSRVTFLYISTLIFIFIATAIAELQHIIPHFALNIVPEMQADYFRLMFPRLFGWCSTLGISTYLITNIKGRLEQKEEIIGLELNRYKDLDYAKSNFLLQVTHELRGPLAALCGYHEMILKGISGDIGDGAKNTVVKANNRTENLLNIIDEMIDYAYLQSAEHVQYTKTDLKVKDIVDSNIDNFSLQIKQKNIKFVLICSEKLMIHSCKDLLNIIFSNLISNAVKYSCDNTTITVNVEQMNDKIRIFVKDEGIGVETQQVEHIFEEFYRTPEARKREKNGTGLGLPLVKRAVNSLNGEIKVYSEKGKGSTFFVELPVENNISS